MPDIARRKRLVHENRVTPMPVLINVFPRPSPLPTVRAIRVWLLLAAIANFVSTAIPLISSVTHQIFGVGNWASSWTRDPEPTRVWFFWTFLGFGCLWATLFLFIRAEPVGRRSLLRVGIAEKAITTVAVWSEYLVFDDVRPVLPVIILVTDLLFVVVFAWAVRMLDRLAPLLDPDEARRPHGSSPPARWLLRSVAIPTFVGGVLLAVVGVIARIGASSECLPDRATGASDPPASCRLLAITELWALPPFVVWLWGGMTAVLAGMLMWISADVVQRRDAMRFGVVGYLIPVVAVAIARFSENATQRPPTPFLLFVIVGGAVAAGAVWLAARRADASALVFGVDLPPRVIVR